MNPPSVLLDHGFLAAVADAGDADHDEAVSVYHVLIDDFLAQRHLLVARADHLAAAANADLFAPIDKLHVARQHRNAADELVRGAPVDIDVAITLVMIHRCKVRRVASFDPRLARYDLDLITSSEMTPTAAEAEPGGSES